MTQPGSGAQVVIDDAVDVEYSQFCLQDMARLNSPLSAEVPGKDWLLVGAQGGVLFHSSADDHAPAIRLELWLSAPDSPSESWNSTGEDTFVADSTELRLWSITAAMGEHTLVLPSPGSYHVRAFVWSQSDGNDLEDEESGEDLERWLIQIWPA